MYVGIRLFVEVLDHAPTTLTHREKLALAVLAENARDSTRECMPGIEDDERIARRMSVTGRSGRYDVINALKKKGVLEVVAGGRKYRRAVYRIAPLDPAAQGPETPDAEAAAQGPENPDAETPSADGSGSGNSGLRVRKLRTQGPELPDPYPSYPSYPSQRYISEAAPEAAGEPADTDALFDAPAPPPRPAAADPGAAFDAWYAAYPRKVSRPRARAAYLAAVKRGMKPADLADALAQHCELWRRERRETQFVPHPSTWLNQERYADEITLPPIASAPGTPHRDDYTPEDFRAGFNPEPR